uniref:Uncharacterized protein n=2 Tax=Graphocephala atropunctata TaxID=36148 RepID=A0A1B6MNV2_9HEMI
MSILEVKEMASILFVILLTFAVAVSADPSDNAEQINKLVEEIVAIAETEILASEKRLVEGGIKIDSKDAALLIKDTGFNVLANVYGKLRELWKLDAETKDINNLIISRIDHSKVLDSIVKPSVGNRTSKPKENTAQTSEFVNKLKKSATDLVKFILTYNQRASVKHQK